MSKVRILVVEDIDSWRETVSSMLRSEPSFEIICEVADGGEAVLMTAQLQPTIVLMDIGLPRLSGIEVAKWIPKLAPKTRIIFLSEEQDLEVVQAALNLGCGYVLKCDAESDLVAAIRSVATGEAFISRQLTGLGLIVNCQQDSKQ